MTDFNEPLTVSIKDAAARSGMGVSTIYKIIARGGLQTVKVGDRNLVIYASLKKLLTPEVA